MEKGFSVDMYGYLVSVYTVASLLGVVLLGAVKLKPKARFWAMALGFSCSVPFYVLVFLSDQFVPMCIFAFFASFLNCVGNTVFSASLMLALPEENRSAILGFISSASVGGSALSTLLYGLIGDVFPLYLVFAAGNLISLAPMLYLCFHSKTREFVLEHCE
jgi:MFS family permease